MRRPSALRLAVGGLPRHGDRDAVQRRSRGHRPVGAERQRRTRLVEAADPVLLVRAFGAEARNRQHRHQRVQLRPQRLHVRDHAELGEPADVGVVDQLRMRDHRPPVARAVVLRPRTRSHPAPDAPPRRRSRGCGSADPDRRPGAPPRPASRPPSCASRGCAARSSTAQAAHRSRSRRRRRRRTSPSGRSAAASRRRRRGAAHRRNALPGNRSGADRRRRRG